MSSKTPPIRQTRDARETPAAPAAAAGRAPGAEPSLVLRDESDEIIDNLKEQLAALQSQLHRYKKQDGAAGGGVLPPVEDERRALDFGLTPHIAGRLRMPTEELAQRLARLVGQVEDPALKAELEHCRDTASFLGATFQRIGEQHLNLTESLTADALEMEATAFCERLESALRQRNLQLRVEVASALPARLRLSPQSAVTVLMTLTELAGDLFGQTERLTVGCPGLEGVAEGEDTHLHLEITGDTPWGAVADGEAVSAVAIRSGVRSRAVVDLLYVEKIIEMRGGRLEFCRQGQRVCGLSVHIPITLLRKEPRVPISVGA